jgi:hypothetical protein
MRRMMLVAMLVGCAEPGPTWTDLHKLEKCGELFYLSLQEGERCEAACAHAGEPGSMQTPSGCEFYDRTATDPSDGRLHECDVGESVIFEGVSGCCRYATGGDQQIVFHECEQ